jgi:hypothetical protein
MRETMQTTVNARRFVGQEISLCPLSRGQSAVILGGLRIGRVSHAALGEGKSKWLWSLTGPHCGGLPEGVRMCGEAPGLAEAKQQLRHSFDCWLAWALEQDGPVHWHWTEAAPGRSMNEGGGLALAG